MGSRTSMTASRGYARILPPVAERDAVRPMRGGRRFFVGRRAAEESLELPWEQRRGGRDVHGSVHAHVSATSVARTFDAAAFEE
jgi:hypothetical protein